LNHLTETVAAWPVQELEIVKFESDAIQASAWQHYMTRCLRPASGLDRRRGSTIWVSSSGPQAAIAWEWVELMRGVLALADPNSLVSNIRFVGAVRGLERMDTEARTVLLLNTIVHCLNWQDRVLAELDSAGAAGPALHHSSALH
jgi:hypothetical protein